MAKAKFWLNEGMRLSKRGDKLEAVESLKKRILDGKEEEDNNVS